MLVTTSLPTEADVSRIARNARGWDRAEFVSLTGNAYNAGEMTRATMRCVERGPWARVYSADGRPVAVAFASRNQTGSPDAYVGMYATDAWPLAALSVIRDIVDVRGRLAEWGVSVAWTLSLAGNADYERLIRWLGGTWVGSRTINESIFDRFEYRPVVIDAAAQERDHVLA